jgi:integrase
MSVERLHRKSGGTVWCVRWREGGRNRSKTYSNRRDAKLAEAELVRLKRLGALAQLDAGTETLDEFVASTWAPEHAATLATSTRVNYAALYAKHVGPFLGGLPLRELTAERLSEWQKERRRSGAGPEAVRRALRLVGGILQLAVQRGRLPTNPARSVNTGKRVKPPEVRPLSPRTVETLRAALGPRDATLVAVLAYAGLRPGEALALRWEDVRERTLLVERALTWGEVKATKTGGTRTVRLLAPLAGDLAEWQLRCGRPAPRSLIFPARAGGPWPRWDWQNWRRRTFGAALEAAGVEHARPYDLRHSFASLLLAEGRSVHYVARQLGHAPSMTLDTYGHVVDEFEDAPRVDAEAEIRAARGATVRLSYVPAAQRP